MWNHTYNPERYKNLSYIQISCHNSPALPKLIHRGITTRNGLLPHTAMATQARHWQLGSLSSQQTRGQIVGVFFPLRSDKDLNVAYFTARRGSCGLSSKSTRLRSHETTPLSTLNQRKGTQSRLWSLLSCSILDFRLWFQTRKWSIWKKKKKSFSSYKLLNSNVKNTIHYLAVGP